MVIGGLGRTEAGTTAGNGGLKGWGGEGGAGGGRSQPCPGCGQSTKGAPGDTLLAIGKDRWHKKCFVCDICKKPIVTGPALSPEGKLVHKTCAPPEWTN